MGCGGSKDGKVAKSIAKDKAKSKNLESETSPDKKDKANKTAREDKKEPLEIESSRSK